MASPGRRKLACGVSWNRHQREEEKQKPWYKDMKEEKRRPLPHTKVKKELRLQPKDPELQTRAPSTSEDSEEC